MFLYHNTLPSEQTHLHTVPSVPGLSWCVPGCGKGQVCVLTLVFPGHLSYLRPFTLLSFS